MTAKPAKRAPRRAAHSAPVFRCLFCGKPLRRRATKWHCAGCRAIFRLCRNTRGCVVRLELDNCGAGPACCQQQKGRASC